MNARVFIAIATAALAAACSETQRFELEVDDRVEYVAAIEVDTGRVLAGSEIKPWPKGQSFPVIARSELETLVVGYSADELRFAGAIDRDGVVLEGTLRAPVVCEPELPRPIWAARWPLGQDLKVTDVSEAPPLTTTGLVKECPALGTLPINTQVDCVDRFCEADVRVIVDCRVELELAACGRGVITAQAGPSNELCLDRSEEDMRSCEISAAFTERRAPPFTVELMRVLEDGGEVIPDFLRSNGLLIPDLLFFGWSYDLTVVADRVIVAGGEGRARDVCRDLTNLNGRIAMFDRATFERIGTSAAPPCLTRVAAERDGEEFFGVFTSSTSVFVLGRFDVDGTLLTQQNISAMAGVHRVVDLEISAEANRIAILFNLASDSGKGGDGGNILAIHALDTLEEIKVWAFPSGQRWAMAPSDLSGVLALADHKNRRIELWNTDLGEQRPPLQLPRPDGFTDDSLLDLVFDAPSRFFVAQGTRDPLVFLIRGDNTLLDRDYFFERQVDPVTSISWPFDQKKLLVSGLTQDGDSFRGVLALYDTEAKRFDPGTYDVGFGIISKMVSDGGQVFALLPWSGQIARITR